MLNIKTCSRAESCVLALVRQDGDVLDAEYRQQVQWEDISDRTSWVSGGMLHASQESETGNCVRFKYVFEKKEA